MYSGKNPLHIQNNSLHVCANPLNLPDIGSLSSIFERSLGHRDRALSSIVKSSRRRSHFRWCCLLPDIAQTLRMHAQAHRWDKSMWNEQNKNERLGLHTCNLLRSVTDYAITHATVRHSFNTYFCLSLSLSLFASLLKFVLCVLNSNQRFVPQWFVDVTDLCLWTKCHLSKNTYMNYLVGCISLLILCAIKKKKKHNFPV